jgi:DNA-binding Xre family transcriptional regulator
MQDIKDNTKDTIIKIEKYKTNYIVELEDSFQLVSLTNGYKILDKTEKLICPISLEPINEIGITINGQCYEYSLIKEWLSKNDKDPNTGVELNNLHIVKYGTSDKVNIFELKDYCKELRSKYLKTYSSSSEPDFDDIIDEDDILEDDTHSTFSNSDTLNNYPNFDMETVGFPSVLVDQLLTPFSRSMRVKYSKLSESQAQGIEPPSFFCKPPPKNDSSFDMTEPPSFFSKPSSKNYSTFSEMESTITHIPLNFFSRPQPKKFPLFKSIPLLKDKISKYEHKKQKRDMYVNMALNSFKNLKVNKKKLKVNKNMNRNANNTLQ